MKKIKQVNSSGGSRSREDSRGRRAVWEAVLTGRAPQEHAIGKHWVTNEPP